MTGQQSLPDETITLTTPDTCRVCGEPSVTRNTVAYVRRKYAVVTKTGKLSWRSRGWESVTPKLCARHSGMVDTAAKQYKDEWGKPYAPPPRSSVGPATLRRANYQAAQMDEGQLTYWDRDDWIRLHPNGKQDKLSRAIAKHCPAPVWEQKYPALPAYTVHGTHLRFRRALAEQKLADSRNNLGYIDGKHSKYQLFRTKRVGRDAVINASAQYSDDVDHLPDPAQQPYCLVFATPLPAPEGSEHLSVPTCEVCDGVMPHAYRTGMCDDCMDRRLVASYIARWLVAIRKRYTPDPTPAYNITPERNWLWVSFPSKPCAAVRDTLKEMGFRWSVKREAWYCTLRIDEQYGVDVGARIELARERSIA